MSKSLGNLVFVETSSRVRNPRGSPLAARPAIPHRLGVARRALVARAVATRDLAFDLTTGRASTVLEDVRAALDDDLDTPSALLAIDDAAHAA